MSVYGVDIADLGCTSRHPQRRHDRPRLSWRRLWSLIEQLPRDSRFVRATVGEIWGSTEHLLASSIDVLQISNWMYASAHSKTKVTKPRPLKRPGAAAPSDEHRIGGGRGSGYTPTEMRQLLANFEAMAANGEWATTSEVG